MTKAVFVRAEKIPDDGSMPAAVNAGDRKKREDGEELRDIVIRALKNALERETEDESRSSRGRSGV